MIRHSSMMDLILALRGIRRNPWFAALVIGTMAIGLGANITMYSLVRAYSFAPSHILTRAGLSRCGNGTPALELLIVA